MTRRRVRRTLLGILLVGTPVFGPMAASAGSQGTLPLDPPLHFEPNQGQHDPRVLFSARGNRYALYLTSGGSSVAVLGSGSSSRHEVHLKLVGADPGAQAVGAEPLPGRSNYFLGNDPRAWRADVPHYGRVDIREVYPGIDLSYYGREGQVEYDFLVEPGADPGRIRLGIDDGAEDIHLDADGQLVLTVGGGKLIHRAPVLYQKEAGERRLVRGRFVRYGTHVVGFEVGEYDLARPLVIDPVLTYSTYLGGSSDDQGLAAAVDLSGNLYVTGFTGSTDFPVANPAQASNPGYVSIFVTKLNPAGSALVYSTYLGGSGFDSGLDVAVDSSGSAHVTGETDSTDFPTVNPLQPGNAGGSDAFVAKLNPSGSALLYSTYLGGSGYDRGESIQVDSSGNISVAGPTDSPDFPLANPLQATYGGSQDGFVSKLNAAGSALVYSTFLGGSSLDYARAIDVDASGNAYVTGFTASTNFPVANALQPTRLGGNDAFISKVNPSGSAFVYSTFLGGSSEDFGMAIAADSTGNAYATGNTYSHNFPTANPFQATLAGTDDVFVAKLTPTGAALTYSTYLGGSSSDCPYGIALDSTGRAHIAGRSQSTDFPLASPVQATHGGAQDGFVAALAPAGSTLAYSTYLGGSANEVAYGIATGSTSGVHVTGYTASTNFPTLDPFQAVNAGGKDAFMARLGDATPVELTGFSIE